MKYALYGYDLNTERVGYKIIIPSNKEQYMKECLGIHQELFGLEIELNTYKVQEMLDNLSICAKVNDCDWFLSEVKEI